jgi:XapX domain-containing protein
MRIHVVVLATGVLVGITYTIRSAPPPVVALGGLLGILIGEKVAPTAKRLLAGEPISLGCPKTDCVPNVFGELPTKSKTAGTEREVRT